MSQAPDTLALALAEAGEDAAAVLDAAGRTAAAADVRGGTPLAEALGRHAVLPPALTIPFEIGAPGVVRSLVEAGERLRTRAARVRRTVRAATTSGVLALAVMCLATYFVLPAFIAQFQACSGELPAGLKLGIEVFGVLADPLVMALIGGLALIGWFGVDPVWLRLPGGRRAEAALAADTLATLIAAGAEVPTALRRVARGLRDGRALTNAAAAIEGGAPIGPALARVGLIDAAQIPLLEVPDQDPLPAVLAAVAAVRRADQAASASQAGRAFWAVYAVLIGGLAILFAVMIMTGSVTVLECLG